MVAALMVATLMLAVAAVAGPRAPYSPRSPYFSALMCPSGLLTVSDNFNRADGTLGANWTTPANPPAESAMKILGNQVTPVTENVHAYSTWTANSFTADQFSQVKLVAINQWNGVILRDVTAVDRCYIGFVFAANDYRFYKRYDGVYTQLLQLTDQTWSAGDTFKMEVYGSNPVRMYIYHNGTMVGDCADNVNQLTTGSPGIGIFSPTGSGLAIDDFVAGNVVDTTSTITSDNFNRTDGSPGLSWCPNPLDGGGIKISGNKATAKAAGMNCISTCRTTLSADHYSEAKIIQQGAGDWTAASARSDFTKWYAVLVLGAAPTTDTRLYAFDGTTYNQIASTTGTSWAANDTVRLETSGTNPVNLTVKKNGSTTVLTFADSTYKYTGTHGGCGVFATTAGSAAVDDWAGQ